MSVRDRELRDGRVWVQWERLWEREEEEEKKKTGGRSDIYGRGKRERESSLFGRKQVETSHEEGAKRKEHQWWVLWEEETTTRLPKQNRKYTRAA